MALTPFLLELIFCNEQWNAVALETAKVGDIPTILVHSAFFSFPWFTLS
jgi:hypothetical protein